jgi:hypothetical protein
VLKLGTSVNSAFKMALETWASWVKEKVDLERTRVFFRTYEPSHWRCFSDILNLPLVFLFVFVTALSDDICNLN